VNAVASDNRRAWTTRNWRPWASAHRLDHRPPFESLAVYEVVIANAQPKLTPYFGSW